MQVPKYVYTYVIIGCHVLMSPGPHVLLKSVDFFSLSFSCNVLSLLTQPNILIWVSQGVNKYVVKNCNLLFDLELRISSLLYWAL